jgi:hypothetical protein
VILACVVQQSPSNSRCSWDETYKEVVKSAQTFPANVASGEALRNLESLSQLIGVRRERAALRKEVLSVGTPVEQVRLEAMIPNPEAFRAAWLVRTDRSRTLVTYGRRGVSQRQLPKKDWNQIVGLVSQAGLRSWLNQPVEDGPAYFVSFDVGGSCGQYALYAPIFSEVMPESYKAFDQRVRREKAIVQHLLRMARDSQ